VNGLIQGCLPIMRFSYGAGNSRRLNLAFRDGTLLVVWMMALGTAAIAVFPAQILGLFTASAEMQEYGVTAMRIMAVGYVFCGLSTMVSTYLQATEQVFVSMLLQMMRQFALLVPVMWLLERQLGIIGIWLSFPVAEVTTFLAAVLLMRRFQKKQRSLHPAEA